MKGPGSKPGSIPAVFEKLRRKSPAPTSTVNANDYDGGNPPLNFVNSGDIVTGTPSATNSQ